MNFKLLLYSDLPEGFKNTYGRFICYRKRLKNGWQAVKIANGNVFFIHPVYESFCILSVKRLFVSEDGKMLIVNKKDDKIIYNKNGKILVYFNKHSELFHNGWYTLMEDDGLCLYDANDKLIASKLLFARVSKFGTYHMRVRPDGDARCAGVFDHNGKRLLFTNSKRVWIQKNGWFVHDNVLYDNLGNEFISPIPYRKVPNWLLRFFGQFMSVEKN